MLSFISIRQMPGKPERGPKIGETNKQNHTPRTFKPKHSYCTNQRHYRIITTLAGLQNLKRSNNNHDLILNKNTTEAASHKLFNMPRTS